MSSLRVTLTCVVLGWLLDAGLCFFVFYLYCQQRIMAMTERLVRCPYCVVGNDFRPMISLADGSFVCSKCAHLETPGNKDLKCHCSRCIEFRSLGFRRCG